MVWIQRQQLSFTSYNFGSLVSEYKTEVNGTAIEGKKMVEKPPDLTVEPKQDKYYCAKLACIWVAWDLFLP